MTLKICMQSITRLRICKNGKIPALLQVASLSIKILESSDVTDQTPNSVGRSDVT